MLVRMWSKENTLPWLIGVQIHYQTLLLNSDRITFSPPTGLKLATILPDPDLEPPIHHCQQVLAEAHGWHRDLSDQPLADAEATWFIMGTVFWK